MNNTDWVLYAYNRTTGAVHLVSQATPADVAKHIDMPAVQTALANGNVWWAATATGTDRHVGTRVFAAPVAGGSPQLVAADRLYPQPVEGNGDGPYDTTVYAEGPDAAHTAAILGRIDATGTIVPMNAEDRDISALATTGDAISATNILSRTSLPAGRQLTPVTLSAVPKSRPTLRAGRT